MARFSVTWGLVQRRSTPSLGQSWAGSGEVHSVPSSGAFSWMHGCTEGTTGGGGASAITACAATTKCQGTDEANNNIWQKIDSQSIKLTKSENVQHYSRTQ